MGRCTNFPSYIRVFWSGISLHKIFSYIYLCLYQGPSSRHRPWVLASSDIVIMKVITSAYIYIYLRLALWAEHHQRMISNSRTGKLKFIEFFFSSLAVSRKIVYCGFDNLPPRLVVIVPRVWHAALDS